MAAARDWADGYREQARADLKGAYAVLGAEPSVLAMLLQMVFEKFAKAALLRTGAVSIEFATTSHAVASRMVRVMRVQPYTIAPLGGPLSWADVLGLIESLERAHPAHPQRTQGTPQLEYPWETSAGSIAWPARDLPVARSLRPPSTFPMRVLKFAMLLDQRFDQIFP
jgi:hypothetical protein